MHDHNHMPETKTKRIFLSIALTGLIFLAEFIGGLWTGSLALLSDRPMYLWMCSHWC